VKKMGNSERLIICVVCCVTTFCLCNIAAAQGVDRKTAQGTDRQIAIIDPARQNVTVQPLDVLLIMSDEASVLSVVQPDGSAILPEIGSRDVKGMKPEEIEEMILEDSGLCWTIRIATLPDGDDAYPLPVGVAISGSISRPCVVRPGRLTQVVSDGGGYLPEFGGTISLLHRGKLTRHNYFRILRGKECDVICQAGDVVTLEKHYGARLIDGVRPWLDIMRDVALVMIAAIEVNNTGHTQGWW